ncbi:putative transcription factor GAGA-Binding-like family [Helianthus anomalus]
MRNWGYYEPSFKEHNGLQLMSPFGDHRDTKPFLSARETPIMINPHGGAAAGTTTAAAGYHHHHPLIPMPYMRDSWVHRERLLHMLPGPGNPNFVSDHSGSGSGSNSIHIMHPNDTLKDPGMSLEDIGGGDGDGDGECVGDVGGPNGPVKKRSGPLCPKGPRGKKPKKAKETVNQTGQTGQPGQRSKVMKRSLDIVINGLDMDISGIPIPVCSCTGTPQQCYRWGSGGWQSACCTTTISMYPLPMSTKRRGARIAGRKMSQGAFKKVLEKLASEGYSFDNAIDLRAHWAKHGTNKFVTIR